LNSFSNFTGGEWRDTVVQVSKFCNVQLWNDVGSNPEDLRELDKAWAKRCDGLGQLSRSLAMRLFGHESRRSRKYPPAPVSQERGQEGRKPVPDNEDPENHGYVLLSRARVGTKKEGNLKLDESCISNPKSEISDWTRRVLGLWSVQFRISDFGFEMQDSSNFKFTLRKSVITQVYCRRHEEGNTLDAP
jgi:hypothetical protein